MKSLNLDIIVSPEIGIFIFLLGITLIIYGYKQGKKEYEIGKFPIIKPALKELIGVFLIIFGFIQIIPIFL